MMCYEYRVRRYWSNLYECLLFKAQKKGTPWYSWWSDISKRTHLREDHAWKDVEEYKMRVEKGYFKTKDFYSPSESKPHNPPKSR